MKIGLRSDAVISCVRTMRGVSSMTMSVCVISVVVGREQLVQDREPHQAGQTLQRLAVVLAQQAREQVRLAVAQPQAAC